MPRPSYPLFDHLTRLEGIRAVPYDLELHGHWRVDAASLARAIDDRTRAVLVVSPNNPTGSFLHGADLALSHFEAVRATAQEYDLNMAGYAVMSDGRVEDAIRLFRRNVEIYPQSSNVYGSLAEAYETAGDKTQAIANYRLSLERDPNNDDSKNRLKALESGEKR